MMVWKVVVSQGIGYPGSMLKQLASPQTELIATEMLTSRVLSLKGSTAPTMYWSGWYYHQQVELPLRYPPSPRAPRKVEAS
jgi:hypothetical protein